MSTIRKTKKGHHTYYGFEDDLMRDYAKKAKNVMWGSAYSTVLMSEAQPYMGRISIFIVGVLHNVQIIG